MEMRDVLLKADEVAVVFERLADGKIRVTTSSWDDAEIIWPNQVLEVAVIGKQVGLVLGDKPIAYLDIDETTACDSESRSSDRAPYPRRGDHLAEPSA